MLKRVLLACTFVAALGMAGVGMSSTAEAHGWRHGGFHHKHHKGFHRGHHKFIGHRPVHFGHHIGHRSHFVPRRSVYRGVYRPVYVAPRSGIFVSFGF